MAEPPFDATRAHRWFAVELNNLAWELVEAVGRSPADTERMIHAAHGACFHWLQVGNPLNHLRAECLLATTYAKAGLVEAAIRHAQRCLELSHEAGDTQSAFDRATAHGCAAVALAAGGRTDEARAQHELALAAAQRFDDPEDRPVFDRLYPGP